MRRRSLLLFVPVLFVALALIVPSAASAAVSVSGYVKLDIQWSDRIIPGGFVGGEPSPPPGNTPLKTDKERHHNQTLLDATQSRVRVAWTDDVMGIKMSGRVEGDFFQGDGSALTSNSRHFRLRHAYARADHPSGFFLLAGQYWALWMNDTIAQPNLVDFNGPAGQIFGRQPQLRAGWTNNLGPMGSLVLEADIEKQSVANLGTANVSENQGEGQPSPLFAGKVSWLHSLFQVEGAFAVADNTETLPSAVGGGQKSKTASAFQVSAQTTFNPVTLFAHYHHQEGLGRLLNGDFATAACSPAPFNCTVAGSDLKNIKSNGFYLGASFAVNQDLSLNGVYGWAKADEEASIGFTGAQLKEHRSLHVNAIQKFWKSWQAGVEYERLDVKTFSGVKGDVNIIHGALWYFF